MLLWKKTVEYIIRIFSRQSGSLLSCIFLNIRFRCGSNQEEVDEGGFNAELTSQAKQSRSEKKARKALCKLGKPPCSLWEQLLDYCVPNLRTDEDTVCVSLN